MTDSKKFVVVRWDHHSPFSERTVFEGSERECSEVSLKILKVSPQAIDCIVVPKDEVDDTGRLIW
jgi:hypothetical protein